MPGQLTRCLAALLLASTATPVPALAGDALPTGGTVVKGAASIETGPSNVTITQTSATGIVNWNSFSIGTGNSVRFDNGSGSTLSRVTGNVTSEIDGVLTATGTLYLVNPAGVVVGPSGSVFTGGSFIASAHDISNDQYLDAGAIEFSGTSDAAVINAGTIASANGDVALIARKVENSGILSAPNGTTALAAGYDVLMSDTSGENGKFAVKVGGAGTSAVNSGTIKAAEIEMRANGGNVYALAGNTDAVIKATGVTSSGGRIFLTAGDGGTVKSTAHIVARKRPAKSGARPTDLDGGAITITGGTVDLSGTVDASAEGQGTRGGAITTIANDHGSYTGLLLARGGEAGAGGNIETSGFKSVDFTGLSVDTSAMGGLTGSWLVDPEDLTVDGAAAATIMSNLASTNVTLTTTATAANGIGTATPGSGDITIASAINWSSANTLTLDAYNNVVILSPITGTSGGLTLSAGNAISAPGAIAVGTYRQTSGAFTQLASSLPSFSATDFQIAGGTFLRATGGDGSSGNPYLIADVYGLQGMGTTLSSSFSLAGDIDASGTATWNSGAGFKPVGDYSARYGGTFNGNGHKIAGLTINRGSTDRVGLFGVIDSGALVENVELAGGSITGNYQTGALVGFSFGTISHATSSATIYGGNTVGGLVGENTGAISHSSASGDVSASNNTSGAGGLVGANDASGTISSSYATGSVHGEIYVGGLVADNVGTISDSYATGAVSGISSIGGLVGVNETTGNISKAYTLGAVTARGVSTHIGGFVGANLGSISQSYATGWVTAAAGSGTIGGFSGSNEYSHALITSSYWDVGTTGQTIGNGLNSNGGTFSATGLTTSDAFSQASYGAFDFANDWYMTYGKTRPFLRAEYATTITNVHQLELMGIDASASYTLANDIDASDTDGANASGMWATTGFVPVGNSLGFSGTLDGKGHVISGLTINQPWGNVGLLGDVSGNAVIRDIGLVGGSVSGDSEVGSLVGYLQSGTITGAYSTVNVSGGASVGGLVGRSDSDILNSHAEGNVTGTAGSIGGLVGITYGGTITNTYATGRVSGSTDVGGLVGGASSTISDSYATGAVVGTGGNQGGLIGFNSGVIRTSYATGDVGGGYAVGGLAGSNVGNIIQSYATGEVNGSGGLGGLVGENYSGGTISQSYSIGWVGGGGTVTWMGGLVGYLDGTVTDSYFAKDIGLNTSVHGIGYVVSTSLPSDIGVTGKTLAALKDASTYAASWDFSFGAVWGIKAYTSSGLVNGGLPFFQWEHPIAALVTADDQTTIYNGTATGDGFSQAAYHATYASGFSSADNLFSSVTLGVSGSNVDAGTTNAITLAAMATGTNAIMVASGTESIAARTVTVSAGNLTRPFGAGNPPLTYAASGLIGGDTLTGSLFTTATSSSPFGRYAITEGTLAASANYILDFVPGTLTIIPTSGVPFPNSFAAAQGRATPDLGPPLTFVSGGTADGLPWQATGDAPAAFDLVFAPGTFEVASFSMGATFSGETQDKTTAPACSVGIAGGELSNVPYPCN